MTTRGCINWFARRCGFVRVVEYRALLRDYQSLIVHSHDQYWAFERHKEEFNKYRDMVDGKSFTQAMKASKTYGIARYETDRLSNIIHIKDFKR